VNLNAHVLRLNQIQEKMNRGEELTDREVAYVKALWRGIVPDVRAFVESVARAVGTDVEGLSGLASLEAEQGFARRGFPSQRMRAEHEARMRGWRGA
jgi:hypothetical protein